MLLRSWGSGGLLPGKNCFKKYFFALKLRNSEQIFALSRQVNVLNFSFCPFYIDHKSFTETSIDETNKTQQKVTGSKFMF